MRIGINIPDSLNRRMEPLKGTMNVSQVCRDAIEAYVEDYERASARVDLDGLDDALTRLTAGPDRMEVDWGELGWNDARAWMGGVDQERFDRLFHMIDVLNRQGRPLWQVPPPHVPGAKTFDERWGERFLGLVHQHEAIWRTDPEFNPRADAEQAYCRAWFAYVLAARHRLQPDLRGQASGPSERRREMPAPEVSAYPSATKADRIRRYLSLQVDAARRAGRATIAFRAGDVHDALGLVNAHANVCQVLRGRKLQRQARVRRSRILSGPASRMGANLVVEFAILPSTAVMGDHPTHS